jgi:hypothetical protein
VSSQVANFNYTAAVISFFNVTSVASILSSFFLRLLRLVLTPPNPLTGRRPRCPAWSSPRGAPSGPPLRGVSGTSSEFAKKANVDFEETKLSLHHTLMKKG